MTKRMLALVLVVLLNNLALGAPYAPQTGNQAATIADRTRRCAIRLSTSRRRNERIEVRLRDNSKLKGYVGVAEESRFTVIHPRTGLITSVPYADVTDLRCGRSVSGEIAKGAIVLGATIGGLMLLGLWVASQTR